MPVKILKNPISIPQTAARVKPVYPEEAGLFGRRIGRASLAETRAAGSCEIWVTCPENFDEDALRRGYEACIRLAAEERCQAVAIPLLLPKEQGECSKAALHLAISALRDALEAERIQVYLVVPDAESWSMPISVRQKLTQYIESNHRGAAIPKSVSAARECNDRYEVASFARTQRDAVPEPCCPSPETAKPRPSAGRKSKLGDIVRKVDAGFSETLLRLIDESGKKDSEIYNRANVSRQHFSKIRNNPGYRPTKPTAIAFAIALELNMEQTRDLIGRAGYTLTRSSVFDLIIMYFIENKIYDLYEINEALFEFDQTLLGV